MTKEEIAEWFMYLQDRTCEKLQIADGRALFHEDKWERPGGGGGRTRVLSDGDLIEKGGVNFSAVHGTTSDDLSSALDLPKEDFYATGVSSVLHPENPHVPITHMNVRYFQMGENIWWFGGGIDLTPHYVDEQQASHFHSRIKDVCSKHHNDFYQRFSKWADEYFYIKHRKETRGIGGIFFDRLDATEGTKESLFDFVKDVGDLYADLWLELAEEKRGLDYTSQQKDWQLLRRGRYVEFNLVYDKGTKFGLETDGRIESILMSLPKTANWSYDHKPQPGSAEEKTLSILSSEQNWINA